MGHSNSVPLFSVLQEKADKALCDLSNPDLVKLGRELRTQLKWPSAADLPAGVNRTAYLELRKAIDEDVQNLSLDVSILQGGRVSSILYCVIALRGFRENTLFCRAVTWIFQSAVTAQNDEFKGCFDSSCSRSLNVKT